MMKIIMMYSMLCVRVFQDLFKECTSMRIIDLTKCKPGKIFFTIDVVVTIQYNSSSFVTAANNVLTSFSLRCQFLGNWCFCRALKRFFVALITAIKKINRTLTHYWRICEPACE